MGDKDKVVAIIPSRLESTRLPNKAIRKICGIPLIVHVMKRCLMAKKLSEVFVATDSEIIAKEVSNWGGKFIITKSSHVCGTDRIAEAAEEIEADIIVNIQGDEALVKPQHIDTAVTMMLENPTINVGILVNKYFKENNPSDIKVVLNEKSEVMYLSRNDIPSTQRNKKAQRLKAYHVVPFRKKFLLQYTKWKPTALEQIEFNEYLRILEKGFTIKAAEVSSSAISVDTPQDLAFVRKKMPEDSHFKKYSVQSK
ncbi:MAG: 3-deoxy-manno-octulosonate cytidylyltransferase [Gammaproteobacteria bacterium]|nr:3-deoxy-manno-octulosonate cytidylyltransferase [Gammaproteobacteria bacterium]|tara:strand:- start:433 stop:1194 length:762 start_codon:yes stop_codon:yes gene_type:complete